MSWHTVYFEHAADIHAIVDETMKNTPLSSLAKSPGNSKQAARQINVRLQSSHNAHQTDGASSYRSHYYSDRRPHHGAAASVRLLVVRWRNPVPSSVISIYLRRRVTSI
jgi:hypothetical protein